MKKKIEFIMKQFRFLDEEYKVTCTNEVIYVTIWRDQIHIKKETIKNRNLNEIKEWIKEWFCLD